ncbi:MAG: hypothetical protein IJD83_06595 [Clostridia bacterium]|nr:hypothetical protein [Clostridia bacterium]
MTPEEIKWTPGEPMSKDYALALVKRMIGFCRYMYYFQYEKPAFNGEVDFKCTMDELNALHEYISQHPQE